MTYIVNSSHIMNCNVDLRVFGAAHCGQQYFLVDKLVAETQEKEKFMACYNGIWNIDLGLQAALIFPTSFLHGKF